jgi:hypothetical protein
MSSSCIPRFKSRALNASMPTDNALERGWESWHYRRTLAGSSSARLLRGTLCRGPWGGNGYRSPVRSAEECSYPKVVHLCTETSALTYKVSCHSVASGAISPGLASQVQFPK